MRIIAHLDMDAFFAAIEERDNPRFFNRAIVVGSDPLGGRGRGVVSTANYKARMYGIHSAMPISIAWEKAKCAPKEDKVLFLGVDMERYENVSSKIRDIIISYNFPFEQVSIDEFFIDCSSCKTYILARKKLREIQEKIKNEEHLSCSVGVGKNKLIAKIASDFKKPHGFTLVSDKKTNQFLKCLAISKIPGVGKKTVFELNKMKVFSISDALVISVYEFKKKFGKFGMSLYEKVRGIDNDPVGEVINIKSVGSQETFLRDTIDVKEITQTIRRLIEDIYNRFLENGFSFFSRISITVRFFDFQTIQRSKSFECSLSKKEDIEFIVFQMFFPFLDGRENKSKKRIRLIGIRLEKLEKQKRLF